MLHQKSQPQKAAALNVLGKTQVIEYFNRHKSKEQDVQVDGLMPKQFPEQNNESNLLSNKLCQ